MSVEIIGCPECSLPAEISERYHLPSTEGPLEHIVVECIAGHGFNMPTDWLDRLRR